jgi:hypothetical protein
MDGLRAPAPLDDLVAPAAGGCDDDRLQEPEAADQLVQLAARVGVLEPVEAVEADRLSPNFGRGLGE